MILTVNLLVSTLVFWVMARLYLWPRLHQWPARDVVLPILLLHSFRHLGLMFLAPGAVSPDMPAGFAVPAAFGDVVAALLALTAIPAVAANSRRAKPLVWIFNLVGALDLMVAIGLATALDAAPHMGAAYWIPGYWVPALLVTHWTVFIVLVRHWPAFSTPVQTPMPSQTRASSHAPVAAR